jgi:hypothetical protein
MMSPTVGGVTAGKQFGVLLYKEALNNSSVNYQSRKSEKRGFRFSSFFKHLRCLKNGGTSLCRGNSE